MTGPYPVTEIGDTVFIIYLVQTAVTDYFTVGRVRNNETIAFIGLPFSPALVDLLSGVAYGMVLTV
jgi:hypothetical protein